VPLCGAKKHSGVSWHRAEYQGCRAARHSHQPLINILVRFIGHDWLWLRLLLILKT